MQGAGRVRALAQAGWCPGTDHRQEDPPLPMLPRIASRPASGRRTGGGRVGGRQARSRYRFAAASGTAAPLSHRVSEARLDRAADDGGRDAAVQRAHLQQPGHSSGWVGAGQVNRGPGLRACWLVSDVACPDPPQVLTPTADPEQVRGACRPARSLTPSRRMTASPQCAMPRYSPGGLDCRRTCAGGRANALRQSAERS